jgi:adenylosuccinate synthase
MPLPIILLSGPSKAGKTELSRSLISEFRAAEPPSDPSKDTGSEILVGDGIPNAAAAYDFRKLFPKRRVVHFHLDAQDTALSARGASSHDRDPELYKAADHVLDTTFMIARDVLACVAGMSGLLTPQPGGFVDVVVGGQYGSEGKGQICGHLASAYDFLMRVGGPNAGHTFTNVHGARKYFHLPSGSRDVSARVLIGAGAVLRVEKLLQEIAECGLDPERLVIDCNAMVISDEDIQQESGKDGVVARIASTGQGVGVATARKILGRGSAGTILAGAVTELKKYIGDTVQELERAYADGGRILLEGTQGNRDAHRFDQLTVETQTFIAQLEQVSGVRVSMANARAAAWSVLDRRSWF